MKNYKLLIMLLTTLLFSGCSDFFDVNNPTNVISQDDLTAELLLPEIEYSATNVFYLEARYISMLQQHLASIRIQDIDQHYETSLSFVWDTYYSKVLLPLQKFKAVATENNQTHYIGVGKILDALSLGMMTDFYGNMPYQEAGLGSENLQPKVDNQEELYGTIQSLLDEAIDLLNTNDTSGYESVPGDAIYGGDISKWIRLAYTLKARYALHLTKINGAQAAQEALDYLANGFTSNDDDFQLFFNDRYKNPWSTIVDDQNSAIFSVVFSEQLINYMNATMYPTADIDPRLPLYADNGGDSVWRGAVNGNKGEDENGDAANTYLSDSGYYFKENSPLVLVSYAEVLFIKAEAEYIVNGGTASTVGGSQAAYDAMMPIYWELQKI